MKYCNNCGIQLDDYIYICPRCGIRQPTVQSYDSGSFGWCVLGFFFPIVGLILWLVWKDTKPASAKQAGMGALIGVILEVVLAIIAFALGFFFIAALSSYGSYSYR